MAKFIELHQKARLSGEKDEVLQNVDDISMVVQQGDNALITLRRPMGIAGDVCFHTLESYEEVKRMLLGAEAQRVPWEAD